MSAIPATATQAQFAAIMGYKGRAHVSRLKAAGRLVLTDDGQVRVAESIERIKQTEDPSKRAVAERHASARAQTTSVATAVSDGQETNRHGSVGGDTSMAADSVGRSIQASRALEARYRAMEAKRAYEEATGSLIRTDAVTAAIANGAAKLRARLEALPAFLSMRVAAMSDEDLVEATIADAIEAALQELARDFTTITKRDEP